MPIPWFDNLKASKLISFLIISFSNKLERWAFSANISFRCGYNILLVTFLQFRVYELYTNDRTRRVYAQVAEGVGRTGGEWRLHLLLGLQVQVYRTNGERGSRRGRTAPEGGTADSTLPDDVSEKEGQQRTGYSQHAEPGSRRNTWAVLSFSLFTSSYNFTYYHFLLWALNEREKEKHAFQGKLIESLLESGRGDNRRDEISEGNGDSNSSSSAIKKKKSRKSLNDRRAADVDERDIVRYEYRTIAISSPFTRFQDTPAYRVAVIARAWTAPGCWRAVPGSSARPTVQTIPCPFWRLYPRTKRLMPGETTVSWRPCLSRLFPSFPRSLFCSKCWIS